MGKTGEDWDGLHLGKFEKRRRTFFQTYVSLYQNIIYPAGKSFSVVMWPWFCKWKTLANLTFRAHNWQNWTKLPKIAWPSPLNVCVVNNVANLLYQGWWRAWGFTPVMMSTGRRVQVRGRWSLYPVYRSRNFKNKIWRTNKSRKVRARSVECPLFFSLFQALGSWGRAKMSEEKKREDLALVLPHFFLSLSLFPRPQLPRAWNRLLIFRLTIELLIYHDTNHDMLILCILVSSSSLNVLVFGNRKRRASDSVDDESHSSWTDVETRVSITWMPYLGHLFFILC